MERTAEEQWREVLEGSHALSWEQRFMRLLPKSPRCKICFAPFGAPAKFVLARLGFAPWEKNPNLCKRCIVHLEHASGEGLSGAEVNLSLAFIDVRGSSKIAQELGDTAFSQLMMRFYDTASKALFDNDALLDKFIGDEVTALFLPFACQDQHPQKAIDGARAVMEAAGYGSPEGPWLPLGAGVHTGTAFVGIVARPGGQPEFTALGEAVNTAGHLASEAGAGEILVTDQAAAAAGLTGNLHRDVTLKGGTIGTTVLKL